MTVPADLTAPWEARVFAIADQLRRAGVLDWDDFHAQVAARAPEGSAPRYDDWLWVLERELTGQPLSSSADPSVAASPAPSG